MSRRSGVAVVSPRRAHEQCAVDVLRQFRQVYGAVRRHFRQVEDACGLSGSHAWMLQEIARSPGIGLTDLANRLSIHRSTASQLAQQLADGGLVEKRRSAEDQRRVGLAPTAHGLDVLARTPHPAVGILPSALLALPDQTLRSLHVNLAQVIEHMGEAIDGDAETPLSEL